MSLLYDSPILRLSWLSSDNFPHGVQAPSGQWASHVTDFLLNNFPQLLCQQIFIFVKQINIDVNIYIFPFPEITERN